LETNIL